MRLVSDGNVKPIKRKAKAAFAFPGFSFRGSGGHAPLENFENNMLRNVISGYFCDVFVKTFCSLHPMCYS